MLKNCLLRKISLIVLIYCIPSFSQAQGYNGLNTNLGNLSLLSNAKSRSISPENFTGEKGKGGMATLEDGNAAHAARDLGQGWKVNPFIRIKPKETFVLAEIEGPGAIQHIWMTAGALNWRFLILRFYWDDEKEPSVEVPIGDFFAVAYKFKQISSLAVCVNPGDAFNSYWVMPFRKKCKITIENIDEGERTLYYQIDYTLTEIPNEAAYFHAQFRRANPLPYKEVYTIVDDIKGKGHYVGTYMAWQTNNNGWWGEGEIKFYMDGDKKFPTINGTGTEDYFCGSYNFAVKKSGKRSAYTEYTTPYAGFYPIVTDGYMNSQTRFGMYRWHITDPVRFENDLKITMQALGWRSGRRYLPLQDDISSVAFWYQQEPHNKFPKLSSKDELEIR
jgi:D-arabinan exo alpha-(1,3)/(1,5)-arabinofuranosidase (non-reducing end)